MGIGDWINDRIDTAGDWLEDKAESVTAKVGELADSGLDGLAGVARQLGADGVAEALDDFGDELVSLAGGEVQERDLGETKDPKELIRGEPSAIHDVAEKLRNLATSIESTGSALRTINVADWTGEAATAFHTEFEKQPQLWFTAADAMTNTAATLDGWWYWVVVSAQAKAQNAITKWEEAEKAEAAYNALSDKDKKTATRTDGTLRDEARAILNDARSQRDSAAAGVVAAIQGYTEGAPTEPPFTERWADNFSDLNAIADHAKLSFTSGLLTSFTGIVQFVRAVNPADTYNLTHPAEYLTNLSDLGTGLVVAAADPGAVVNGFLSDARKNPFEFAGALTGDALLTVATGGAGGAAKVTVQTVEKIDDVVSTTRHVANVVEDLPTTPAGKGIPHADTPGTGGAPAKTDNLAQNPGPHAEAPKDTSPADTHASGTDNPAAQSPDSGKPVADNPGAGSPESGKPVAENPGGGTPESGKPVAENPAAAQPDSPSNGPSPDQPHSPGDANSPNNHDSSPETPRDTDGGPNPHADPDGNGANPHPGPDTNPSGDHTPEGDGRGDSNPDTHPHDSNGGGNPADNAAPEPKSPLGERAEPDRGAHDAAETAGPEADRSPNECETGRDPVDIATGEFLLPETDLALPGILPLILKRTHRSNYRFGRWFGPSWSATLDMRVVVEEQGVTFLGEDGMMLAYPHAEVAVAVLPTTGGQRWTLTRTDTGGYRVHDPDRELIWHFAPEPGLGGLDSQLGNFAISAITDRHLNRIRFHYDADANPVAVTHSGGYRVDITTSASRITALTVVGPDHDGLETHTRIRAFTYKAGSLAAVTNGVDATTHYTYDDQARMLSWTDSNSTSMHNTYDESGRVILQQGTAGILDSTFDYLPFPDGTGTLTTITDSRGATTTHGFDHDLRLRDLVDPSGARTHYDYNADRRPLKVVAPDGATTHYRYTDDGDIAQITRPDGAAITIDYFWRHRPSRITDVDGTVRHQEWDANGNLTAVIDPLGVRTERTYHPNGAIAELLTPTGARTTVEVDPAGLTISTVDAGGAETRITRDAFGRPVHIIDALGATTTYRWSPAGKLLHREDPDGYSESWTWDGEGNLLTHTDRADGRTQFTYGPFDLLASRTDPDGSTTCYTWDTERRLTTVTNPIGQTWTYEYDATGRLIVETDYSGATTHYTHDKAGRVAAVTPATGITRHHEYDILGRLTEVTAATGEWRRYRHDPAGRILTAATGIDQNPTHTLEFTYTPAGHLASQQLDDQPAMRYAHDQFGRQILRTTPSGATTTWQWDHNNRIRALSADDHQITFDYDALGRPTGWRVGEIAVTRTLSDLGRVLTQDVTAFPGSSLSLDLNPTRPDPQVIRQDTYDYRPDGYITAQSHVDSDGATTHRVFDLDRAGRVTSITRSGIVTEAYTYDALSNIVVAHPSDSADNHGGTHREYRNNLIVRQGRTRYSYDRSGRLTQKVTTRLSRKPSVWHYEYDGFDQLVGITTPDGQTWRYTYDALGRRSSKQRLTDDGSVLERVDYLWDGTKLIEQSTDESSTRWQYRPDTYAPLSQTTSQDEFDREFYAIVSDLVGTPVELIDPDSGTTVAAAAIDLWGRTRWHGRISTPLRFPGQIFDAETGLHYNLHRVYDPSTGRFLTRDPLGLAPAPNPNTYPHNPTSWIDPLGLACEPFNTNDRVLSDPNPVPKAIREQYEQIHMGNGTPRIDPETGLQKVFEGRELGPRQRAQWEGSLEWDVPGTPHRILQRPDGLLGYVWNHDYSAPFLFPGPWYPEGGKIPKRLGG
ncbi:hypothetical protein H0264_33810 [Nocardia huaxiensis]|uniref:RHS repeat-associated protein n=1 Tax=Nocardia huaxiensis TaxID=2755382 RepID=A0A7D6ZHV0_9NOCA|nr:DUF6531 domain-containing protein [Nocardia huaxiensis]QLY30100.1 hypothetical protein H0264_33810 [Nocardia huaxiensis]